MFKGHMLRSPGSSISLGLMLIFITLLLASVEVTAQSIDDAVRFNTRHVVGTARNMALGSAMGGVGGDISAAISNPAGLTTYRTNEWSFSPGFVRQATSATAPDIMGSTTTDDSRSNITIPSAGYVKVNNVLSPNITQTNFAFGVNRIADFNEKWSYDTELNGSITRFFRDVAGTQNPGGLNLFFARPAFDANVMSQDTAGGAYFADIDAFTPVRKQQTVDRSGGIDEVFFAYAIRLRNNLSFGVSMAIPFVAFDEEQRYVESRIPGVRVDTLFNRLDYDQDLSVRGSGFNLKIGGKAEINRWLHVGGSIHTPTWWRVTEEFSTEVRYDYIFDPEIHTGPGPDRGRSGVSPFEYSYRTPWRFLGSVAVRMKKLGFLFSEVEYQVGGSGRFRMDAQDVATQETLNRDLADFVDPGLNLRLGAEFRVAKDWRLRAGSIFGKTPFLFQPNANQLELQSLSAGIGRWWGRFFIDLGYRRTMTEFEFLPYDVSEGSRTVVLNDGTRDQVVLTAGIRLDP